MWIRGDSSAYVVHGGETEQNFAMDVLGPVKLGFEVTDSAVCGS